MWAIQVRLAQILAIKWDKAPKQNIENSYHLSLMRVDYIKVR